MMFRILVYAGVALAAAAVGFTVYSQFNTPNSATPRTQDAAVPSDIVGQRRPDFKLPNLEGETVAMSLWDGEVVLVNFWATWCAPCRDEIPHLIELQRRYGGQDFRVIGIAIDEQDPVKTFSKKFGINYPILIGPQQGIGLTRRFGNNFGVMPYSALIDRQGIIRHVYAGPVTPEQVRPAIQKLI